MHGETVIDGRILRGALYFNSGMVQSPEQAIVKAYDSLPGIERPDFVPS